MCYANNEEWKKTAEGIELPNQEKIRTLGEEETYKWLRILEVDTIKQMEMKGINTWLVSLVRCFGLFLT